MSKYVESSRLPVVAVGPLLVTHSAGKKCCCCSPPVLSMLAWLKSNVICLKCRGKVIIHHWWRFRKTDIIMMEICAYFYVPERLQVTSILLLSHCRLVVVSGRRMWGDDEDDEATSVTRWSHIHRSLWCQQEHFHLFCAERRQANQCVSPCVSTALRHHHVNAISTLDREAAFRRHLQPMI